MNSEFTRSILEVLAILRVLEVANDEVQEAVNPSEKKQSTVHKAQPRELKVADDVLHREDHKVFESKE